MINVTIKVYTQNII